MCLKFIARFGIKLYAFIETIVLNIKVFLIVI